MTGRAALAIALAALACSSSSPPPPDTACKAFDYAAYTPGPKHASFKNDVVPIFARSCAFGPCHASEQNPMGKLYLGPNVNNVMGSAAATAPFYPPDDATLAKVHGGLVGGKSVLAVTMPLVQAGSPKDSFLMHKVDGDQGCADIACNAIDTGKCGETMPQRTTPLEAADAAVIRDWIAQGAAND